MKSILIMAGGTGGHIFPGLAVAEQMRAAGWDVVWMGARGGMEERLVPRHGYRTAWIRAKAARGKGILQKLLLPANLLYSFWESARHIRSLKPDVVLGLGGYVAFPGGMMASLLNRPLALHEQNAIAGLTNRVLAQVSDKVMVAFPEALKGAEWTGNPVRAEIAAIAPPEVRFQGRAGPLRVLVVGGSLGAQALNEALPRALSLLPDRPRVVHQAGEKHLEALKKNYAGARVRRRAGCVHRRHGAPLRRGRSGDLPRRRGDDRRALRRRHGEHAGAVPARGRRPPDGERAFSFRARRRGSDSAARPFAGKAGRADSFDGPNQAARHGEEGARARQARCGAHRRRSAAWSMRAR